MMSEASIAEASDGDDAQTEIDRLTFETTEFVDQDLGDQYVDWNNLSLVFQVRETLTTNLVEAYMKCVSETARTGELTIITGPTGVGKTSLALTLENHVERDGGFLIRIKFDQFDKDLPVATTMVHGPFAEAFTRYIFQLSRVGEETLTAVKQAMASNMDRTELQVLREIIPALDILFDFQSSELNAEKITMKGANTEDRLIQIFLLFIRTISSVRAPVVLFLDDIQWASQCTFQLLTNLLFSDTTPESRLMLLCTCRSDEVSVDHPFSCMLRDVEDRGAILNDIPVGNRTRAEVDELVSSLFRVSKDFSQPLSGVVYHHTDGNLLFLIQLLKLFHEEGVLSLQASGHWIWDITKVFSAANVGSLTLLVERKVRSLEEPAQEILKIASCLGSTFPTIALSFVGVASDDDAASALRTFEKAGLLVVDQRSATVRFVHDRVHQTVYQLVPTNASKALHLVIGRSLRRNMPQDLHDSHLLLIAHQISLGADLIVDEDEKLDVAKLFYQAGQMAALASAFVTASAYLSLGIELLGAQHWTNQYELSLCLYNFLAEVEYYNRNLPRVDELIEVVLKEARSFEDTLQAQFTRIYSLGSRENMSAALEESLNVLQQLGERLPRKPTLLNVMVTTLRFKNLIRGKSDDSFLSLPLMRDNKKQAIRLLLLVTFFAFFVSPKHVPLVTFRVIENTLKHGMSEMACVALGQLSMVCAIQGNIDEAYRYNQLALRLYHLYEAKEWQGRVAVASYAIVFPLKRPFRDSLEPLYAAHRGILVLGDIHFSVLCLALNGALSFSAGCPLAEVVVNMRRCRALCVKFRQTSVQSSCDLRHQLVLNLMGESNDPVVLTGEITNEEQALQEAKERSPTTYAWWHFVKLQLAVYMNDLCLARLILDRLRSVDKNTLLPFAIAIFVFFEGLAAAMSKTRKDTKRAKRALSQLRFFAKHAPFNYLNKVYLIEAELSLGAGKHEEALAYYNLSIDLAKQEGLIHDQALACERAGYAHRSSGGLAKATLFLRRARSLYGEWGAHVKVAQLACDD